ncbi:MAG: hypothetical protein M1828_006346 [Chrysothrix sp. TS-e1954]|nr:MAG: hypothetical protein M1828_006346 [Chrysothrix sp. TS-e1954]
MEVKEPTAVSTDGSTTTTTASLQPSRKDSSQTLQAIQDVAFGSIAGIFGKVIEYPFDTVKVRLQSQPANAPPVYTGPLDCFRQAIRHDGVVRGLYRGISAPLAGAAIETSSLFFSYRLAQDALRATIYRSDDGASLPMGALSISGAASGAFTSLLLTPIELVKCKMQVPLEASATSSVRLPGAVTIIGSIFRQQGFLGFWHGQLGTLIRETGGSAAWFGSFEGVSLAFRRMRAKAHPSAESSGPLPIYQQLLAGATAGMSYNFVFYPADTIKSRMQTEDVQQKLGAAGKRATFWETGKVLWRDQGLKGMYRGCGITVGRAAPSSAIIFTIYEGLKEWFG